MRGGGGGGKRKASAPNNDKAKKEAKKVDDKEKGKGEIDLDYYNKRFQIYMKVGKDPQWDENGSRCDGDLNFTAVVYNGKKRLSHEELQEPLGPIQKLGLDRVLVCSGLREEDWRTEVHNPTIEKLAKAITSFELDNRPNLGEDFHEKGWILCSLQSWITCMIQPDWGPIEMGMLGRLHPDVGAP